MVIPRSLRSARRRLPTGTATVTAPVPETRTFAPLLSCSAKHEARGVAAPPPRGLPTPLALGDGVERLVNEAVCQLVVLAPDGRVAHVPDLARDARGLEREIAERLVLHPVLPAHLLYEQLRVGDDLQHVEPEVARTLEPRDEGPVFGDVVRGDADRLAVRCEHRPVLGLDHEGGRGRPGIPAGPAVREHARPHAGGSMVSYRSNAGSS